jgi:hypothetical protein
MLTMDRHALVIWAKAFVDASNAPRGSAAARTRSRE